MKKILIISLIVVLTLGSVGAYMYMQGGTILNLVFGEPSATKQADGYGRDEILLSVGALENVSAIDVATGFWYTYVDVYGNEHVFYFNPNSFNERVFTKEQLDQMLDAIKMSKIDSKKKLVAIDEENLPQDIQFHNTVYSFGEKGNILDMQEVLEAKMRNGTELTKEELFELAYLYELRGEYGRRDTINEISCTKYRTRCSDTDIIITGTVTDIRGEAIQGVYIEVLGKGVVAVAQTDNTGMYKIGISVNEMEKIRIKAAKRNYSDGIANVLVVTKNKKNYVVDDIILGSPITIVTIDQEKETITGSTNKVTDTEYIVLTEQSTYRIPKDAIVHKNGTPYDGIIEVYLYEFTKEDIPESLMTVDTFDQVRGYAGDLMKTFGMPYIQFFSPSGEELHVQKSNPMVLTYRIVHMKELYENTDQIYTELTDADMEFLVSASIAKEKYPIDRAFLIKHKMLRFPAFWVFDRGKGVWENIGIRVLSTDGIIETEFYTVSN